MCGRVCACVLFLCGLCALHTHVCGLCVCVCLVQFVQLLDLSSKLEHLEEDHKTSHGARERLRREKEELEAR